MSKELAAKWFNLIDKRDFAGLKALAGPAHKFHNPMSPTPQGADEHLGMVEMMTGALQGGHTLERLIAEGEYVAVRGRWKGKHVGEFNGVPASGKSVEFTFTDIMHFQGGKLADEYLEMNPMAIMAQIGAK